MNVKNTSLWQNVEQFKEKYLYEETPIILPNYPIT